MRYNLGSWDRWIRILLGAVLFSLVFLGPKTNWGWLGLFLIGTGLLGVCPVYALFGVKTLHSHSRGK